MLETYIIEILFERNVLDVFGFYLSVCLFLASTFFLFGILLFVFEKVKVFIYNILYDIFLSVKERKIVNIFLFVSTIVLICYFVSNLFSKRIETYRSFINNESIVCKNSYHQEVIKKDDGWVLRKINGTYLLVKGYELYEINNCTSKTKEAE